MALPSASASASLNGGKLKRVSAGVHYRVELDGCPVQDWSQVSGLSMTVEKQAMPEGGNMLYTRSLTKSITYGDVTLTRAVDGDSKKLLAWVAKVMEVKFKPTTAIITLLAPDRKTTINEWTLTRVVPISYKGPDLGADKNSPANETITIMHGGFAEAMEAVGKISAG